MARFREEKSLHSVTRSPTMVYMNRVVLCFKSVIFTIPTGAGAWTVSNHTWPRDPAYFGHRFSNGPVWVEYLADRLKMELDDYAVGGGTYFSFECFRYR